MKSSYTLVLVFLLALTLYLLGTCTLMCIQQGMGMQVHPYSFNPFHPVSNPSAFGAFAFCVLASGAYWWAKDLRRK